MQAALTRLRASVTRNWPLELLTLAALVAPAVLLLRAWGGLPEMVPVHFDSSGAADRLGPKSTLWILHWVSLGMWLLFTGLQMLPIRRMNVPVKLTKDNEAHVERVSMRALSGFKFVMVLVLAVLSQQTLRSAQTGTAELPPWFVLLATLGPVPIIVWLVVAANRKPASAKAQGSGS